MSLIVDDGTNWCRSRAEWRQSEPEGKAEIHATTRLQIQTTTTPVKLWRSRFHVHSFSSILCLRTNIELTFYRVMPSSRLPSSIRAPNEIKPVSSVFNKAIAHSVMYRARRNSDVETVGSGAPFEVDHSSSSELWRLEIEFSSCGPSQLGPI